MRSFNIQPEQRPEQAKLLELLRRLENAPAPGADPSGNTYGSLQAGLTQLGEGIGHRMRTKRIEGLEGQMQELDPTGEIVRALMRGRR